MVNYVYARPLSSVLALMGVTMLLWGCLGRKIGSKAWRNCNFCLGLLSLCCVLYLTVFNRSGGSYEVVLRPFTLLEKAREQREFYRAMLMNVFLFFPLGLTLSNMLPRKWNLWGRIALTTLCGCLLSAGIEYAQYYYSLGRAETDDVLCNTLGAFLGACSLLIAYGVERVRKKTK